MHACSSKISAVRTALFALIVSFASVRTQTTGIVQTDCGPIQGTIEEHGLWLFAGIPYAVPPINSLRFKPSSPIATSASCPRKTVFQATNLTIQCIQASGGLEDCLVLNIWTQPAPQRNSSRALSLKPVIVSIHGGALIEGSGASVFYKPWREDDFIAVSINYRLGPLGWLALDALSSHDPRGVSGNYGLSDVITALKWIQGNIKNFGGDPDSVTIAGQSSGATIVLMLIGSPSARGLFHGAISMTAGTQIVTNLTTAIQRNMREYIPNSPCGRYIHDQNGLFQCLMNSDASALAAATPETWMPLSYFGVPPKDEKASSPAIIDGVLLPYPIKQAIKRRVGSDVPIVLGFNHDEPDLQPYNVLTNYSKVDYETLMRKLFSPWGSEFFERVQTLYNDKTHHFQSFQQAFDSISSDLRVSCCQLSLAREIAASYTSPLYNYVMVQTPTEPLCWVNQPYCPQYAFHGWDLLLSYSDSAGFSLSPKDQNLSRAVFGFHSSFVRSFNPNVATWTPFTSSSPVTLRVFEQPKTVQNLKSSECKFWEEMGFDKYCWQWNNEEDPWENKVHLGLLWKAPAQQKSTKKRS